MSGPLVALDEVFCLHRTPEGDVAALQGVSLEIASRELMCVLGPSGAGKSTLLRVISGLQTPAAGRVRLDGHDIGRLPERARAQLRNRLIGFVTQRAGAVLPSSLAAEDAVALPLALRGAGRPARRRRAQELLEATGLQDHARARPAELSGGERQRLALCMAIAHRPALLLADEPTAELDTAAAEVVRATIARLAETSELTAIIVTHDPATAASVRRTVRIRDGRIAAEAVDGRQALVVGRGGLTQLPEAMLELAGIAGQAHVEAHAGRIVLTPAAGPARAAVPEAPRPSGPRDPGVDVTAVSVSRAHGRGHERRVVLDELTAAFQTGGLTVLTGPSGSGKTTLLRLLAGLDRPDSGSVVLDGRPLEDLDAEGLAALRRRRIGYVSQDPLPVGFLSATENVSLALALRGWAPAETAERARLVLYDVGLGARAGQPVSRLSAGEAQRVTLARALAGTPGLLLVDEPTSRLDQANARLVADLLAQAAGSGQTVICASHDEELVRRADAVVALGPA